MKMFGDWRSLTNWSPPCVLLLKANLTQLYLCSQAATQREDFRTPISLLLSNWWMGSSYIFSRGGVNNRGKNSPSKNLFIWTQYFVAYKMGGRDFVICAGHLVFKTLYIFSDRDNFGGPKRSVPKRKSKIFH